MGQSQSIMIIHSYLKSCSKVSYSIKKSPVQTLILYRDVLHKFRWEIILHPPHSPGLAHSGFYFSSKLKKHFKWFNFELKMVLKQATWVGLRNQPPTFFKDELSSHRAEDCVALKYDYVENWRLADVLYNL